MADVVESYVAEAGDSRADAFPRFGEPVGAPRDRAGGVGPGEPGGRVAESARLAVVFGAEARREVVWEGERAGLTGFGGAAGDVATFEAGEACCDGHEAVCEVDVFPADRDELTAASAGDGGEVDERAGHGAEAPCGVDRGGYLAGGGDAVRGLVLARGPGEAGDVTVEQLGPFRVGEHGAQHGSGLADGCRFEASGGEGLEHLVDVGDGELCGGHVAEAGDDVGVDDLAARARVRRGAVDVGPVAYPLFAQLGDRAGVRLRLRLADLGGPLPR